MNSYEEKLKTYLKEHQIQAEHLSFNQSCHSVAEAAVVVGALAEDFVKSICMIDLEGNFIVAIVGNVDFDKICSYLEKNFRRSGKKIGKAIIKKINREYTFNSPPSPC